jgi:gamma-glutamyl hercynylcysteine S-oxide synthase
MDLKQIVAAELEAARDRSTALLDPLPEEDQVRQHSPIMSPLVWDLAHVGNYEELWLLRAVAKASPMVTAEVDNLYDAFQHARAERARLAILGPSAARSYIGDVRGRVLDTLDRIEFDPSNRLLNEAFVYGMVAQHEQQHDETMLATIQLRDGAPYTISDAPAPPGRSVATPEVRIPGGRFAMGTDVDPWAYDNEMPAHDVDLAPFWIDTAPVDNGSYLAFVEAGGYRDPRLWTEAGWAWRQKAGLEHPEFWQREGGGSWSRLRYGRSEELPRDDPVQHVCWYEADAYARWAGKRLPTEVEWEMAASWDPVARRKLRYPWGDEAPDETRANLGQRRYRPAPVGAYPGGVSPSGCHQMLGDVWEWTSSDFLPYPGFGSFPYREYSEVFFGDGYKVLRGGSWATHPVAIRNTFRNWDFPIRRQIFAGFRCARDA